MDVRDVCTACLAVFQKKTLNDGAKVKRGYVSE